MRYRRIQGQSDGRWACPRRGGLGLAWLLGSLLALAGTVLADSRDQGQEKLLSVDEVRAELEAIRSRNGTLTIADFLGVVRPSNRRAASVKDLPDCYAAFLGMLRPPIKLDDLIALHEATREAIHDVRVIYDVRADGINMAGVKEHTRERQEFAMSGDKLLYRTLTEGDDQAPINDKARLPEMRAIAYDGKVERSSVKRTDGASGGTVENFKGRSRFYDVEANPLLQAMLVDSDQQVGIADDFRDLLRLIKHEGMAVFEERRDVDGRPCIVVGHPSLLAYLDPDRNFCVTRFERTEMPDGEPIRKSLERQLSNFQDCGNGLWLPKRIVVDEYTDGKPRFHREVAVREWHVNEGIPDSVFEEVIPKGVTVIDEIKGTSYVNEKKMSIQSMMDLTLRARTTPQSKRRWWLFATNAAIVVAVMVAISSRRRVGQGALEEVER